MKSLCCLITSASFPLHVYTKIRKPQNISLLEIVKYKIERLTDFLTNISSLKFEIHDILFLLEMVKYVHNYFHMISLTLFEQTSLLLLSGL